MSRPGSERPRQLLIVAVVLALAAGGCGDDDNGGDPSAAPGTTAVFGDVVFGSGSIPEGFPDDIPIPDAATIGSTLVDEGRGLYEVTLLVPTERDAAIVYYETNIAAAGYEITAKGFEGVEWRLEFRRDDTTGAVLIRNEGVGITAVALDLTTG